ncbi:MAG: HAD family hydrolase [Desulfosudis oleivorans]|nr:HAD family hydrolase [Desulfosudis oleivorans]
MSVIIRESENKKFINLQRSGQEVLSVCSKAEYPNKIIDLDIVEKDKTSKIVEDLSKNGFRVLAIAYKTLTVDVKEYSIKDESELILLGYIAFLDPPKETASQAIKMLNDYGVNVKILTGDNDEVTVKIAKDVGLVFDKTMIGAEIEKLSDSELIKKIDGINIFQKLSPDDKARIIKALSAKGHVVGYLGDGINDSACSKNRRYWNFC